jgi:hypothetical protein
MNTGYLIIFGVIVAIAGSYISRRFLVMGRPARNMKSLYRDFDFRGSVNFKDFIIAMKLIGKSYKIDPCKLLPADSFQKLAKSDSWSLGSGAEKLQDFAEKQGKSDGLERVETIREYIMLVYGRKSPCAKQQ